MKQPLLVLTGPTAVGKTKLSIALAKAIGGEIISADSMQVYRHMDIGSAKVMPEEMDGVRHYLIDEFEPDEEFHIVKFQQMAKEAMSQIYANGNINILVGGTGFYIQSLLYDIDFSKEESDTAYRTELTAFAKEYPQCCRQIDDDEQGGLTFEIEKGRLSFRLTAPYSEERKRTASDWAKKNGIGTL